MVVLGFSTYSIRSSVNSGSFFLFGCFVLFFRATLVAYRGSQARDPIGAVAAGLYHSHSKVGSEPHLLTTAQLKAMPDP